MKQHFRFPFSRSGRHARPSVFHHQETGKATRVPLILRLYRLAFRVGAVLAPPLAGKAAYDLWFKPVRFKPPESERQARETARRDKLRLGKHLVQLYRWGEQGPVVLMVHGWSGRGSQMGAFVPGLLAAGYQVVSFDLPAHGESSGMKTNILEVVAVIDAIASRFGPLHALISHSFGGACIALALRNGLAVNRVVVISPPANTRFLFDKFVATLQLKPAVIRHMVKHLESEFGAGIWDIISMEDNVAGLSIPALVFHDRDDRDIDFEQGQRVAGIWPGAKFVATDGLGHRRIMRDKAVIEQVVGFIAWPGCCAKMPDAPAPG